MDTIALSLTMKRLVRWLDHRCQPDDLVGRQFDAPPFGHCYVTIDPERQGNVASINLNRVYLCGTEAGLDAGSFARLIDLFTASGYRSLFAKTMAGDVENLSLGGQLEFRTILRRHRPTR